MDVAAFLLLAEVLDGGAVAGHVVGIALVLSRRGPTALGAPQNFMIKAVTWKAAQAGITQLIVPGANAREVTVTPVPDESRLRNLAWIEDNRRAVDKLSGGKLGYVYIPNTSGGGYASFNRYFFAQTNKEGAVIDERFNSGGLLADYVVEYLNRQQLAKIAHDLTANLGILTAPRPC